MPRALVAALLLSGCGRIAFDTRSDAGGDARAADTMLDGIDALQCPAGYTLAGTSCYRAGGVMLSWTAAEAACEADAVGSHLVVVDDATEAMIVDMFRPAPTDTVVVGASDLVTEGVYRTVIDTVPSYLLWTSAEPDGAIQDCLNLHPDHLLGDGDCAFSDDYVCEYDGIPAVPAAWGQ